MSTWILLNVILFNLKYKQMPVNNFNAFDINTLLMCLQIKFKQYLPELVDVLIHKLHNLGQTDTRRQEH